jgi:CyaY protein
MNVLVELDKTLKDLYQRLDKLNREDFEFEEAEGKLTITFEDNVKLIVSRQSATAQIWLAEPGGGWKYSFNQGAWLDDKRGTSLYTDLNVLLTKKLGDGITL